MTFAADHLGPPLEDQIYHLGEGLSGRKSLGEAEESKVGIDEPRILPNQIQEVIKSIYGAS
jgi:hypothetical protein